ncbi:hypothetical protein B0H11DRAFT_434519 [Mycena galericulata]|nr:hypothetical protein B0H11DRAFT_434519 [Mycena galericulata]
MEMFTSASVASRSSLPVLDSTPSLPPFSQSVAARLPLAVTSCPSAHQLPPQPRAFQFVSEPGVGNSLSRLSSPRKRVGDDAAPRTDARNQNQFETLASNTAANKRTLSTDDATPEDMPSRKKKKRTRHPTTDLFVALPSSTFDTVNQRVLANINIGKQSRDQLKETCALYGIAQATTNKTRGDMIGLLQAYSAKGDWSNLETQARNSHKGPKEGSAPTAITRRRDAAIADSTIKLPPPPVRTALPADEYLKPQQTLEERQSILDYADKFVRENPILSPEERRPPQPMSEGQWKKSTSFTTYCPRWSVYQWFQQHRHRLRQPLFRTWPRRGWSVYPWCRQHRHRHRRISFRT